MAGYHPMVPGHELTMKHIGFNRVHFEPALQIGFRCKASWRTIAMPKAEIKFAHRHFGRNRQFEKAIKREIPVFHNDFQHYYRVL